MSQFSDSFVVLRRQRNTLERGEKKSVPAEFSISIPLITLLIILKSSYYEQDFSYLGTP